MVCGLTIIAAGAGLSAVVGWDHQSSSRRQLLRERRWFLVETSLRLILGLQLLSLLVFLATADHLKTLFTGAMCAVGSLNASPFGMPALTLKTAAFVLCGLWLVTDRASPAAATIGLVRFKVGFVVVLAGVLVAENVLQIRYFADLDPEIITSCCATVFASDTGGVAAGLASLPVGWSRFAFFGALAVTLAVGLWAIGRHRSTLVYSILAVILGLITTAAVITWIAPAYYELPTHHCPLCLLAPEHGFVGYPLYLFLAIAVIAGAGSGLVHALRSIDIHRCIRVNEERRLCAVSVASFVALAVIALWPLVASPFRLEGY
jgi:hypothetical protein